MRYQSREARSEFFFDYLREPPGEAKFFRLPPRASRRSQNFLDYLREPLGAPAPTTLVEPTAANSGADKAKAKLKLNYI